MEPGRGDVELKPGRPRAGPGEMCNEKLGGQKQGQACADPGARTPIGVSGNFFLSLSELSGLRWSQGVEVLSQRKVELGFQVVA